MHWSGPFIGVLVAFVVVSLVVLLVRLFKVGNKRRVTFQEDVEEREVVELDSGNYGAAGNKVSEGWCKDEGLEKDEKDVDKTLVCGALQVENTKDLKEEKVESKDVCESEKMKDSQEKTEKEGESNLLQEKEAMITIKEQAIELEKVEVEAEKQKSGIRKVLEKFPFLKSFGSENPSDSKESLMTVETSKPDFINNGLPSYSEATKVDEKESEKLDQPVEEMRSEDSTQKKEEAVENEPEIPDQAQILENTSDNQENESIDNAESQKSEAMAEEKSETEENKPQEKKSRFRFSLFSNEK